MAFIQYAKLLVRDGYRLLAVRFDTILQCSNLCWGASVCFLRRNGFSVYLGATSLESICLARSCATSVWQNHLLRALLLLGFGY
jgi:hypothetical protein